MARPWIKLDVGLLDDQRFGSMPLALRGVWTTAYLIIARVGDSCKDRATLSWLLGREGVRNPDKAVQDLDAAGWLEDIGDGRITIRGFKKHQLVYRGPSDLPEAKAAAGAGRSHHGGASGREGARRGVSGRDRGEERRKKTRADASPLPPARGGAERGTVVYDETTMVPFGEMMRRMGLRPDIGAAVPGEQPAPNVLTDDGVVQ